MDEPTVTPVVTPPVADSTPEWEKRKKWTPPTESATPTPTQPVEGKKSSGNLGDYVAKNMPKVTPEKGGYVNMVDLQNLWNESAGKPTGENFPIFMSTNYPELWHRGHGPASMDFLQVVWDAAQK